MFIMCHIKDVTYVVAQSLLFWKKQLNHLVSEPATAEYSNRRTEMFSFFVLNLNIFYTIQLDSTYVKA